jgi:hypothetical protein
MPGVSLDTNKYTYDELAKKYHNFASPAFSIKVDGKDIGKEGAAVASLTLETTVTREADVVVFTIANAYDMEKSEFRWLDAPLALGKELEVSLGYRDSLRPVFYGYITAINISYTRGGNPEIQVTGMDPSFKLMRAKTVRSYANKSIGDIVKEVARVHGLSPNVSDATRMLPVFISRPQNDYQLLHDLAEMINFEFFVVGSNLYFRKKVRDKTPLTTLYFGRHLRHLSIEQNLSEQVAGVKVIGWDPQNQKTIVASGEKVERIGDNSRTGVDLMKKWGKTYEEILHVNVSSQQEAQELANAAVNERALRLVTGETVSIGIPEIRAGRCIRLEGLGKKLNQTYYIVRATHAIDETGYVTSFTFQGNAV